MALSSKMDRGRRLKNTKNQDRFNEFFAHDKFIGKTGFLCRYIYHEHLCNTGSAYAKKSEPKKILKENSQEKLIEPMPLILFQNHGLGYL